MNVLLLATILFAPMPPPVWLTEQNPMPPPVIQPVPTGLIDTIRAAKALIAKGNALADRGKALLDAAQRDGKITIDVRLPQVPTAIEVVKVAPEPVVVELVQRKRPPVLKRLPGPRNLFRCPHCGRSDCLMFLGQALRTTHGISDEYLDELGPKQWGILYDNIINSRGPVATVRSSCENGRCATGFFRRLGSRIRRR